MAVSGVNSKANRVDRIASELFVSYRPARMVADYIAPVVKTTGTYFYRNDPNQAKEVGATTTQPGAARPMLDGRREKVPFVFDLRSVQELESTLGIKLSSPDIPANVVRGVIEAELLDTIYLSREVAAAGKFFAAGSYASGFTAAATAAWDSATLAQLHADLEAGASALSKFPRSSLGLLLGLETWSHLMSNAALRAHFAPTTPNNPTEEMVANFFGVSSVQVGRAKNGSANVWGNSACLFSIPSRIPGDGEPIREDVFGVTFRDVSTGYENNIIEEPAYGVAGGGNFIAAELWESIVIAAPGNGYLITGC